MKRTRGADGAAKRVQFDGSVPNAVYKRMIAAGATAEEGPDQDILLLRFAFGDAAWQVWNKWAMPDGIEPVELPVSGDPLLQVFYPFGAGGVLVPLAQWGAVNAEIASLLATYAPLRQAAFAAGGPFAVLAAVPPVAPPMAAGPFPYHHSTIAMWKVQERIETGINCPSITAVPAGAILADLSVTYTNCVAVVRLVRK